MSSSRHTMLYRFRSPRQTNSRHACDSGGGNVESCITTHPMVMARNNETWLLFSITQLKSKIQDFAYSEFHVSRSFPSPRPSWSILSWGIPVFPRAITISSTSVARAPLSCSAHGESEGTAIRFGDRRLPPHIQRIPEVWRTKWIAFVGTRTCPVR